MLPPLFLNTMCKYSAFSAVTALTNFTTAPGASGGWYGANVASYIPIVIPWQYPMKRFWVWNGSSVAGNFDIGLYSREGAKVVSTGSFAQAGTNIPQYVSVPYVISPGSYYLAIASSSGSSSVFVFSATTDPAARLGGFLLQNSAFPLPNLMNPSTTNATLLVLYGLTLTESGF